MGNVFVLASESGLSPQDLLRELGRRYPLDVAGAPEEAVGYLDTFDWLLLRAGLLLTSSTPAADPNRTLEIRVRVSEPRVKAVSQAVRVLPGFAENLPEGPVRRCILPVTGRRRLFLRGSAKWTTTRVAVLNEDEKTVVRLVLREGRAIPEGEGREVGLFPRLECHSLKGYGAEERQVLRFLRRNFDLEPEGRTEELVVFQALGEQPFDYSSAFDLVLDPEMPAAEATREVFRTLFRNVRMNHEGVLRDWDPEFLHDFRVAVRRTRSALTQIQGVLPEEAASHFTEEFRWLGTVTGPTRDLDVYLLNIPAYRKALGPEVGDRLEPLVRLLREKKREELRNLRRALRSRRFRRLNEGWTAFLDEEASPAALPPGAKEPIRRVASDRIWKVFGKVIKKGQKIGPESPARKLHRLRIECKKLRYLLTFFESLYPADTLKPMIKELKKLQDHLGDFNDAQVQREALGRFAEELMEGAAAPPETLLAMGQLMGQLRGKQREERNEFLESFRDFTSPKKRRRFQDLFTAP